MKTIRNQLSVTAAIASAANDTCDTVIWNGVNGEELARLQRVKRINTVKAPDKIIEWILP